MGQGYSLGICSSPCRCGTPASPALDLLYVFETLATNNDRRATNRITTYCSPPRNLTRLGLYSNLTNPLCAAGGYVASFHSQPPRVVEGWWGFYHARYPFIKAKIDAPIHISTHGNNVSFFYIPNFVCILAIDLTVF